jgi:hypothetical protein
VDDVLLYEALSGEIDGVCLPWDDLWVVAAEPCVLDEVDDGDNAAAAAIPTVAELAVWLLWFELTGVKGRFIVDAAFVIRDKGVVVVECRCCVRLGDTVVVVR